MMLRAFDIFKFLKTGFMVLALVLSLCACSSDKGDVSGAVMESDASELDEQHRACWQAGLLSMFYDTMGESSLKAYPNVTKSAMPFMMVCFALWLSIRLLKHVSSVVPVSNAEVWTEVGRMAFLCLVCGLLASSTGFLIWTLNTLIFPVYYAFLEYGSQILELTAKGADLNSKGQMLGETCLVYTNSLACSAPPLEPISYAAGKAAFPSGPADLMNCLVCATSDRLQLGFTIAKEQLSATSLSSWVIGLCIFVIFLLVKLAFVTYLVDSIFRMNIVVIILPLLILAFPFKATRKWTKQGLLTIFNSAAIMMFLVIIATMSMLAMETIIQQNSDYLSDKYAYQEFGVPMLAMLLIAFLVLKSCNLAVTLASRLVGGGGSTNFQKRLGKLAAWAGKGLFVAVTAGIGSALTTTLSSFKWYRELNAKVQKLKSQSGGFMDKISGRDQGGDDEE